VPQRFAALRERLLRFPLARIIPLLESAKKLFRSLTMKSKSRWLFGALVVGVVAAGAAKAAEPHEVRRWEMHEFTLRGRPLADNPFRDAALTGQFTSPLDNLEPETRNPLFSDPDGPAFDSRVP
jgi:hypothetical protein